MKRWMWWVSWIPSGLGIFIILTSLRWKLTRSPFYVREWGRIGYPDTELLGIGLVQLTCLALYLIPPTSVLGMVLFTGYLGGAIASYVRMREPYPVLVPLTTCLLLWLGLYLREARLRALLPFRRNTKVLLIAGMLAWASSPSLSAQAGNVSTAGAPNVTGPEFQRIPVSTS